MLYGQALDMDFIETIAEHNGHPHPSGGGIKESNS